MKKLFAIMAILLISGISHAQDAETDQTNKKEIVKLAFITGNWQGQGWMMGQDGKKHAFTQTEIISFKLDSTALLVEGLGLDNGKVIHNAMAIITFNKKDNHYNFQSYLANGRGGKFKAELIEDKLYWYPNENMRYIIYLNQKGQWHETGEMKRNEGWFRFFEMTLDKK